MARRIWLSGRERRVWFYRPQLPYGLHDLFPIYRGHDEYAHWVLVLGWPLLGRVCIALWECGDPDCLDEARDLRAGQARDRSEMAGGPALRRRIFWTRPSGRTPSITQERTP